MDKKTIVRVGTRKSELAMTQTMWVVNELKSLNKGLNIEVVQMSTIGDQILNKSLSKTGEKSLFTKELEEALLANKVDLVVNSLKDMPSSLPSNLTISAVSKREDPRDAVIMHPKNKGKTLHDLEPGSTIGTSSLRRVAQLKKKFPDLKFKSIFCIRVENDKPEVVTDLSQCINTYWRGNLNTRLRKLDDGNIFAAIVLAVAGVKRLKWDHRISYILTTDECLYAVGQGALAIETRMDDQDSIKFVSQLHDKETVIRSIAERAFLKTLGGGCSVPQAVHSWIVDDELYLKGGVFNLDGSRCLIDTMQTSLVVSGDTKDTIGEIPPDDCCEFASITTTHRFVHQFILKAAGHLGRDLGLLLLKRGAKEILDEAREQNMMREDDTV